MLTSVLMLTAFAASWQSITEKASLYYAFLLALQTGLLGLFASLDVVLFYIFFEFTLIPLFFLIGIWGGPQRRAGGGHVFLVHARRQSADIAGGDCACGRALSARGVEHASHFRFPS